MRLELTENPKPWWLIGIGFPERNRLERDEPEEEGIESEDEQLLSPISKEKIPTTQRRSRRRTKTNIWIQINHGILL